MDKHYIYVKTADDLTEMIQHINDSEYLAYDTETTGLNVRQDKIIGFAVSGKPGFGYYLPMFKWNGQELEPIFSLCQAKDIINMLQGKKLIMHNASYDCRITKNDLGIDLLPSLYCDTILLKHACDEDHPFGLKDIAKKIQSKIGLNVEEDANKEQIDMVESIKANGGSATKEKYELYKADSTKIGIYAAADTDLTIRIFEYYSKLLREQGSEKFFYQDEVMPLLREVTIPMESLGIPVDIKALESAQVDIDKDIQRIEHEIQKLIKPHLGLFTKWYLDKEFPPRRSGEFVQYTCIYASLPLPKTKSGRYSVSAKAIDTLPESTYKSFLRGDSYLTEDQVRDIQMLWWDDHADDYMFNISSKHHLAKLFFDTLGEESITKTEKGNPQMNDLFLDSVKDKYKFVPLIRIYNKLNKLKSAYIDRFLERQEDGMFYPTFFQHRTISGRYGGDLMQLPRPIEVEPEDYHDKLVYKYTNMMRKFFISGEKHVFIDSDYESLEPHVFAHVSGDEGLRDIFRNGHDFYSTIAIATEGLQGVSADKQADNYLGRINKGLRQKAKAYSLGIPYGMEAFLLSKTLDIGQKEAERLIEQYLNAYPKLKKWMEESNKRCKDTGIIRSQAGRIRHMKLACGIFYSEREALFTENGELLDSLELWKKFNEQPKRYQQIKWKRKQMKNFLNNAKNFQIQSLAASITNRACIAISRELKRQGCPGYICCQIHDQIIVRVPKNEAEKWRKIVQYLMENTYRISLDLKAPAEIGVDFYEAH